MQDDEDVTSLDRPVWQSLSRHHARFAHGNDRARRFRPDVNMFASTREDTRADMEALASLFAPAEDFFILQRANIHLPEMFEPLKQALGVQMVYNQADLGRYDTRDIRKLGDEDASEMLALAKLTEPGPFVSRTHEMGDFFGVRQSGRLIAMAGERMRFGRFAEVSGVCTHPDYQGQGLAGRLSAHVAARILARGEIPFLHAWAANTGAIRLYEKLGFVIRTEMQAAHLRRCAL